MNITKNIHEWLFSLMPDTTASIVEMVLIAVVYLAIFAVAGLYLVLLERRVAAWFQLRLGPNRVGWQGLLQTMADALKLVSKELTGTIKADKFLYNLAPYFVIVSALMAMSLFPFSKEFQAFDINIGIFFLIAISSIGVIGILLAGWSSNNKYALIGAMRSGAMMISYEISLGMALITMVVLSGTMSISGIVESQANGWNLFKGHLPACIAFLVYLIAGNAEANRGPFDLAEAEQELTAGYHTEYSGMHFGFFYLAEYLNLFIVSGIAATVFLGGWMPLHVAGLSAFNGVMDLIPGFIWFFGKAFFIVFLLMWIKWTFPRLRIDQVLNLEWKYLIPICLFNLLLMVVLKVFGLVF